MPIDVTEKLRDVQQFEVLVNGPGDARSLTLISGEVIELGLTPSPQELTKKETFRFLVGPQFAPPQKFLRATASATIGDMLLGRSSAGPVEWGWGVTSVDADLDDESGRVEIRVEIYLSRKAPCHGSIMTLRFDARILTS